MNDWSGKAPSPGIELVQVYPNPVEELLTLEASQDVNILAFSITDLSGVEVFSGQVSEGTTWQAALSSGIYVLRVETNQGVVIRRIQKM